MLLRIAWRSLWRHSRRTVLTVFAISMGLALGVFLIALEDGGYDQVVADAVRIEAAHVTVEHPEYAEAPAVDLAVAADTVAQVRAAMATRDDVLAIRPVVLTQALATTAHGTKGIAVFGVDPATEVAAGSPLVQAQNLVAGKYFETTDEPLALIGSELADELALDVGRRLVLTASDIDGEMTQILVRIAAVFRSGSSELDSRIVQIPIDTARGLVGLAPGEVHRLGLILAGTDAMDSVRAATKQAIQGLPDVQVRPWQEVLPELSAFIQLDMAGNYVMNAIIIGLILFIIFNTLYMSVMEREREFAVLLALGTPRYRLLGQVMAESAWIGLLSVAIGLAVGAGIGEYFRAVGLDMSNLIDEELTIGGFFFDPVIYPLVRLETLATLGSLVLLATVAMGLIPARRATRLRIADTLRSGA